MIKQVSTNPSCGQPSFLNTSARSYHLAKAAANDYLYLVFNEPQYPSEPFQWKDGAVLTKDAYNAFKSLAEPFELETHAATPIAPEMAAFGDWELYTEACLNELVKGQS